MSWREWLFRRPRAADEPGGSLIPQDPSGRVATGETQHLHVDPAVAFWIRSDRTPPAILTWHSSDTSVARLEVAPDGFSALVRVLSPGRTEISVSDGLAVTRKVVVVRERPNLEARSLALTIEPILERAGAGDGRGKDETPVPA